MFHSISWYQYLNAIAIVLILWYVICLFLFYKKSLSAILKGNINLKRTLADKIKNIAKNKPVSQMENSFEVLENLVKDIKISILEKAGEEVNKEILLKQLQSKVANYDGLRQPAYQIALNNFIINHSKQICGVVFSEQELESAWQATFVEDAVAEKD